MYLTGPWERDVCVSSNFKIPFEMKIKFFLKVQLKGLFVFGASSKVLSYTKELMLFWKKRST